MTLPRIEGCLRTFFAVQVVRVPTNLSKNFSCSLAVVTVCLPSGLSCCHVYIYLVFDFPAAPGRNLATCKAAIHGYTNHACHAK